MSKKKQKPPKKSISKAKTSSTKVKTKPKSVAPKVSQPREIDRPPIVTDKDPLYDKIFNGLAALILVLMLLLSLRTGINGDDIWQNNYSDALVNWYATGGTDTTATTMTKGNMRYYGGFFDIVTGVTSNALGYTKENLAYHNIRHLFNAFLGFLVLLFTALLAKEIAGRRAALLAMVFMFCSPRFLGHAMMNPKDIPFAAGTVITLYFIVQLLKSMPKPKWSTLIGLSLGIGLGLATRAGGLLLIAYLFMFAGLHFLFKYGFKSLTDFKLVGKYAMYTFGVTIAGFLVGIAFWPFALVDPLNHPLEALTEFSKLGFKIRVLFQGENIMSDKTAWHYIITWIWRTIPLFTLVGLLGSVAVLKKIYERYSIIPVSLVFFTAIFPVVYVIAKDSVLHDGWRHFNFVYPSLVLVAVLAWTALEDWVKENKIAQYAVWGVLGLMILESTIFIARNSAYSYVYFNPVSGGISNNYGKFETDYWGLTLKQGIDWLKSEGIIHKGMKEPITIATTFSYNASRYIVDEYKDMVKVNYVKYDKRYDSAWDYGLFPTRYIKGPHLRDGTWPSSKAIHTIDANGVPLLAILKDTDRFAYKGQNAVKKQDWATAVQNFTAEVNKYPDNDLALIGLANAQLNSNNIEGAKKAIDKVLVVAPDNIVGLNLLGLYYLRTNRKEEARQNYNHMIQVNPDYYLAYYYLALIQNEEKNYNGALENLQNLLKKNPKFKQAYSLAAQIYEATGNTAAAKQYSDQAAKLK